MTPLPEAIVPLSDYSESINMLIVAESGYGKTVFAGTADQRKTDGGKALFLATENGTIAATRMGSTADVWPMESWKDVEDAFKYLKDGGTDEYNWAMLDSITEMQKFSMDNALRVGLINSKGTRDPDVPQIQDHLKVQQQTLNFLRRFNNLPINCLYTALPLRLEDEDGKPYFLPALDGKQGGIAQQAMGYMHVVGHGVKRNIKDANGSTVQVRRVYFQSVGPYKAKDRYDALGKYLDNPTVPMIEELINKGTSGIKTVKAERVAPKAIEVQQESVDDENVVDGTIDEY